MRRVIVSVMFVILLTMINALPASAGWYDGDTSLFICITYPEGEYRLGSEVQFTVHVFSRGEYIEPDSLNVTVGIGSPDPLDMEVTEVSTGMYTGSFTASLDHVVPGSDSVDIHAEVEWNGEMTSGSDWIPLVDIPELVIHSRLVEGSMYIGAGETRTVEWECRYADRPVDCEVELEIREKMGIADATPERVSEGVYRYEYTFPGEGNESTIVVLELDAVYHADNGLVADDYDSFVLYHNNLMVWSKRVQVTESYAKFEVHVSQMDGKPAGGAHVKVKVDYGKAGDTTLSGDVHDATADANGIGDLEFGYDDMAEDENRIEVKGTVTWNGLSQDISFIFVVRDLPEGPDEFVPSRYSLDVDPESSIFDFDRSYTYRAVAYMYGEVLSGEPVYCYLTTDHQVLAHANATTGPDGTLSIDLMTPKEGSDGYLSGRGAFVAPAAKPSQYPYETKATWFGIGSLGLSEDQSYMETMDDFRTEDLVLRTDKVEKAKPTRVRYDCSDVKDNWEGVVILGNDPRPTNPGRVPLWTFWSTTHNQGSSPYHGGGFFFEMCQRRDGRFECDIIIPENMPSDGYFIWAFCFDPEPLDFFGEYHKTNMVSLKVGEASDSEDDGVPGITVPSWSKLLAVITLVVVVVAFVIMRRRPGKDALAIQQVPAGTTPAEVMTTPHPPVRPGAPPPGMSPPPVQ